MNYSIAGNLSPVIGTHLVWILLTVVGIIFFVVSLMLFYHWQKYGMHSKKILLAEIIFVAGGLALLLAALIAALNYYS
ncbi:hypothetical protein KW783_01215 [Candidatus Parcubacteria bacterium]|nr:hypothetical protein [Candidatus Parcubacteria bacterium]